MTGSSECGRACTPGVSAGRERRAWEHGPVRLTVVDSFTDRPFTGNPAAVAIVDAFPDEECMRLIAREMNLSETAFVVPRGDGVYDLRWFTPTVEIDLCGHATLAAAHVLGGSAAFDTRSGRLTCRADGGWIEMDFPARVPEEGPIPQLPPGTPAPVWTGCAHGWWLVELPSARDVVELQPDIAAVAAMGGHALVVTALEDDGSDADVVSRVFAPNVGVPEDPVTGSAHCMLAPYWSARLGRTELLGRQASARGGYVRMRLAGDRVLLGGRAVTVSHVELLA